jgi:ABC-2 type transport system permease protein
VPMRGSLVLLYALSGAFIVAMLGVGLLISTVARNQLQGMQIGFFVMLPSLLLSGFMFPREAMPAAARALGYLLPLTFYLEILRGVLLKGLGLDYLWRPALALVGFAVVLIALSVARFSKTLE